MTFLLHLSLKQYKNVVYTASLNCIAALFVWYIVNINPFPWYIEEQ